MKIIVLSDGETWEVLNPGVLVVDITDEQFTELESGGCPKHMNLSGIRVDAMIRFPVKHESTKEKQ